MEEKSKSIAGYIFSNLGYALKNLKRKKVIRPNQLRRQPRMKRNPISGSLRHEIFKRDCYRCVECGQSNRQTILHVDHLIPVAQGGTDELGNLQTLCQRCNLAKSNRKWTAGEE